VTLRDLPYWSAADDAELDLLTHEFVDVALLHRDRCEDCVILGQFCEPLARALQAVLDWRRRRLLQSQAAYLRAREAA
jgi:hypothetical protein